MPTPPSQRRRRPYRARRKGLHRRKHHLSPRGLAHLRAALKKRAAWRRAHGIKLHHRFHHRKPLSKEGRQHLSLALKKAALKRKQLGLHRHLSPAARARLAARLRGRRHVHHGSPQRYAIRRRTAPKIRFRIKPRRPRTTYRIKATHRRKAQ